MPTDVYGEPRLCLLELDLSSEQTMHADVPWRGLESGSEVRKCWIAELGKKLGLPLKPGSRFFVFNADVNTLIKFMKFGTGTATGESDALPPPDDHPSLPDDNASP